jgi:molecular chaperone GrpE
MSESKQTIDQSEIDGQPDGELQPDGQPADEQKGKSPGASAPGGGADADDAAAPGGAPDADDAAAAGGAPDAEADANELQVDLDELGALAAKRDEYLALAQRTQADFENYRKRVARESALAQQRGVVKLAKELLPAIDNLDRALDAAASQRPTAGGTESSDGGPGGAAEHASLLDGVRLVRSELSAALARVGVESFSPGGEAFDPSEHEAIASVPQPENGPASGTIVEVYQAGYRLADSVIRPARVVVAA